jgi:signal transduction histidine kinase
LLAAASAAAAALAAAAFIHAAGALGSAAFHSDVSSMRDGAVVSAVLSCVLAAAILAAGLYCAVVLARSVLRPLGRLRSGAVELTEVWLPDALRHISQAGGEGRPPGVRAVGLTSADEIGEIARAFDQVQEEVLHLAANEAGLRGRLSEMFAEVSGRGQALMEQQMRFIGELGQGEQDPGRLATLARMSHVTARMRRYSQNLLVLAGQELPGHWNQPVPLADVIGAAVSQAGEHARVSVSAQPGIAVSGPAADDVVHLIGELAENAASLSAAGTPVAISGRMLASGGALIDVTDQGVGMSPDMMAQANWRLENPPPIDDAVARNMGLSVVGRLAARHGIKVRLQPASAGGLTALVWLPDALLLLRQDAAPSSGSAGAEPRWDAGPPGPPGGTAPDRAVTLRDAMARSPHPAPTLADLRPPQPPPASAPPSPIPIPAPGSGFDPSSGLAPGPGSGFDLSSGLAPGPGSGFDLSSGQPPRHARSATRPRSDFRLRAPAPGQAPVRSQPLAPDGVSFSDLPGRAGDDALAPAAGTGEAVTAGVPGAASGPPGALAADSAEARRLPIYDAVESDWFRSRREPSGGLAAATDDWASPADRGWDAARTVLAPTSSGVTTAGLPVRVPRANLIPGAISGPQPDAPGPARSADAVRDRLSGLQRGVGQGRAAVDRGGHDQAP